MNETGGGDQIFRPFVLILSFVALAGLLLTMFAQLFVTSASLNDMEADLPEANSLGVWDLDFYTPTYGYNVTNASIVHKIPKGETGGLEFDSADKRVYVVRDNDDYGSGSQYTADSWKKYPDFIGVKRKASDLVGGKVYRYAIPLQKFEDVFDLETNTSRIDFTMSAHNYTIILKLMDNQTERIWWNNYTLYLAQNSLQNAKSSMWSAVRMILMGEIPNVNPLFNRILAITVDFSLAFVLFTLISRVVSTIMGGGG